MLLAGNSLKDFLYFAHDLSKNHLPEEVKVVFLIEFSVAKKAFNLLSMEDGLQDTDSTAL